MNGWMACLPGGARWGFPPPGNPGGPLLAFLRSGGGRGRLTLMRCWGDHGGGTLARRQLPSRLMRSEERMRHGQAGQASNKTGAKMRVWVGVAFLSQRSPPRRRSRLSVSLSLSSRGKGRTSGNGERWVVFREGGGRSQTFGL